MALTPQLAQDSGSREATSSTSFLFDNHGPGTRNIFTLSPVYTCVAGANARRRNLSALELYVNRIPKFLRDSLKWALFELGAGYYARKLATGPEADLRREFIDTLPLSSHNGQGSPCRILDVGCGPGHVSRALAQRGFDVTGVDRSRRLLQIAKRLAARRKTSLRLHRALARSSVFRRFVRLLACHRRNLLG